MNKRKLDLSLFIKQYKRKAGKGIDPNDRQYDRKVQKRIKKMKAEEVDKLLRDED